MTSARTLTIERSVSSIGFSISGSVSFSSAVVAALCCAINSISFSVICSTTLTSPATLIIGYSVNSIGFTVIVSIEFSSACVTTTGCSDNSSRFSIKGSVCFFHLEH